VNNNITVICATARHSDGVPFEESEPELGVDPVPEAIRALEDKSPMAQWVADRMRFPGEWPSAFGTKGSKQLIVSQLAAKSIGVLVGVRRPHGRISWRSYVRNENMDFNEACAKLREWTASNGSLDVTAEQRVA